MKERIKMEKIIKLENVSLAKQGQTILKNLNWQVNKGEHWAILGLNGSGKSTLLRLLMAENWKTQGKVTVLGTEFGAGDIPQLRTKIGVVGSFIAERLPSHLTAEEIVLTGKYKSGILYAAYGQTELNQAREILTSIGGQDLIGRSYASLSQGEKQLLLIARSLMEEPELLILDEATSGSLCPRAPAKSNQKDYTNGPSTNYPLCHPPCRGNYICFRPCPTPERRRNYSPRS